MESAASDRPPERTVRGQIEGTFTQEAAARLFAVFERELAGAQRVAMILDCRTMTDYTTEARTAFTEWMSAHKRAITKVAIITDKTVWHMAIATMSLVSGLPMRGFAKPEDAEQYVARVG